MLPLDLHTTLNFFAHGIVFELIWFMSYLEFILSQSTKGANLVYLHVGKDINSFSI